VTDDFIQYGERIRSPWEAKFWAYYWRFELLSQAYVKVRKSFYNNAVDKGAICDFYARADDIFSQAETDIKAIMKDEKAGTPEQDFHKVLKSLFLNERRNPENAKKIYDLLNRFASKSGIRGQTERFHMKPWDRVRESLGVKPNGDKKKKGGEK